MQQNTSSTQTTVSRRGRSATSYSIKGAASTVEITAGSYDALMAKKPLCESVTKQCTNVASQVWDTFLREVAPQVKAAELAVEDDNRQNCVGNISECFQKACKDHIDPNDEEGSYDMCLSRPGTMLNVCKIPLNNCGISAESETAAASSPIWNFVVARLASMRVDACTREVKECMQDEDRCGKDYTQCIGLDTDAIVRMCPYEKLTGCQHVYGEKEIKEEAVYDNIANMIQGLLLNIDNNMLSQCQKAAQAAMVKVCGDSDTCTGMTTDENLGARSLEYKICEYTGEGNDATACHKSVDEITDADLGKGNMKGVGGEVHSFAGNINGTMYWEKVGLNQDGNLPTAQQYLKNIGVTEEELARLEKPTTKEDKQLVKDMNQLTAELDLLQTSIDNAINAIASDPTVKYCMEGRTVQGMKTDGKRSDIGSGDKNDARYPNLLSQIKIKIANAALKKAKENYYKKYDELNEKMSQDMVTLTERMATIAGENEKNARREIARKECVGLATSSSLPRNVGIIARRRRLCGGNWWWRMCELNTGVVTTRAAENTEEGEMQLHGSTQTSNWNYKETVTSTFNWDTMVCHKCTKSQQCSETKRENYDNRYCKTWADPVETCTDTQF